MNLFEEFVRFLAGDPTDEDCQEWCERVGAKMQYGEDHEHHWEYTYENIAKGVVAKMDKGKGSCWRCGKKPLYQDSDLCEACDIDMGYIDDPSQEVQSDE